MNNLQSLVLITMLCSWVFIGVGILSFKKKTPMHFWSNQADKRNNIKDVRAYNREHGQLWLLYGITLSFFSALQVIIGLTWGPILYCAALVIGLIVIIMKHGKIYDKYKRS